MRQEHVDLIKHSEGLSDIPICADLDEDCDSVTCKVTCWLHAPEEGRCPYLNKEQLK